MDAIFRIAGLPAMGFTQAKEARLGFGCSTLMGRITRRESLRILDVAYSHGIRHFDIARSYGYGQAEGVFGEFLWGKRDSITLVTKVGFVAPKAKLGLVRTIGRGVVKALPSLRPFFRRRAASLVAKAPLTPEFVRASLCTSLRELRTDYVDVLLLHEATADDLTSELYTVLTNLVQEGKIREFGVGSDLPKLPAIISSHPRFVGILQFENNPAVRATSKLDLSYSRRIITHRAVGHIGTEIGKYFQRHPAAARQWSDKLNTDVRVSSHISQLLLGYALARNPAGVVLFSTLNERHLGANAQFAQSGLVINAEICSALENLAALLPTA